MWKSLWARSPQVGMGIGGKLCELVAVGLALGRLKPDTTGSSHRGRPAFDSTLRSCAKGEMPILILFPNHVTHCNYEELVC